MKTKKGLFVQTVLYENVLMADGVENIDFNNIVSLNPSALTIWKAIEGKEFTVDDMVAALLEEYEVEKEIATADCKSLLAQWREIGIVVD